MRDERLGRYYLNGSDAFRLKLWVGDGIGRSVEEEEVDVEVLGAAMHQALEIHGEEQGAKS